MPNLRSLPTSDIGLELRPLSSSGITRIHRYYEPLRHPRAPSLTLTGCWLAARPATPWGFPCCVCLPLAGMPSPLPRRNPGVVRRSLHPRTSAFPVSLAGRLPHQIFRGLLSVRSRYGLHARQVPYRTLYTRGFSRFVTSTTAPVATGRSDSCRAGFAPAERQRLITAHNENPLNSPKPP